MRLRRLVIAGFKTFASRAEVTLDRGITAIVGPNGSGKSNLVDALRWALGETNARELRGQRMDEVIYAGGGQRSRAHAAEVELVIDNEEGGLPVDDPEVAVTRRVVRGNHDTEYRINGDRARLRDLERLLGATGLTQNGYAVVAQNDIDGIIEATPTQRRVLVEQAAGVRALRAACEEALGRIATADHVLRRIDDLLNDAEPRLAELAEQAHAALEQREITTRLADLRGSLAREEWRAARGRLKLARRRHEQAAARADAAAEADTGFGERARVERTRLEAARAARDAAGRDLEGSRVAAERALGDARRWGDRLRAAVLQRSVTRAEVTEATEALEAAEHSRQTARALTGVDAGELERDCERLRAAASEAAESLTRADERMRTAASGAGAAARAAAEAESRARQTGVQLELLGATVGTLDTDVEAGIRAVDAAQATSTALRGEAERLAAIAAGAEAARETTQREVETAWEAVNRTEAEAAAASRAARASLAEAATLQGRVLGALGGDGGVARAVAAGRVQGRRVADAVRVRDPADAIAVAAALEVVGGAWVVDDLDAAAAFLDQEGPREQLLAARTQRVGDEPPAAPPWRRVVDAVEITSRERSAVSRLLHGVWLAPDPGSAREAIAHGAVAAILPGGTVVTELGVRGGGTPAASFDLLAAERDASLAAERTTAAESAAIAAIAAAAASRERLNLAESDHAAAAEIARDRSAEAATAGARQRAALEAVAEAEARLAQISAARQRHGQQRRDVEDAAEQAARRRDAAAAAVNEADRLRESAEREVAELRAEEEHAQRAARDAELDLARLGAQPLHTDALGPDRLLDAARLRVETATLRLLSVESEALAAIVRGGAARGHAAVAVAAVDDARESLQRSTAPLIALERAVNALEVEHAEVAVAVARAEDELTAARGEMEAAEGEMSLLAEAMRDEGDDESGDWDPQAAERAEREIVRLERRVAALGPVNALAPGQHDALHGRVKDLREHRADLGTAGEDIRAMARRLAADLERRFDTVFGAVSFHFQQLFSELFPGGRATLRLEEEPVDEEDDSVVAAVAERRPGVEILAQPPGKRLGPLRLLSGGERALTALAMVLALQHVNPSPFYVFDEVDAALDDSNVLRFTRLLRRLAAEQQFIMVTHNHITMAAADVLWGITIDSDGVSSVIGVRFDADTEAGVVPVIGVRQTPARVAG